MKRTFLVFLILLVAILVAYVTGAYASPRMSRGLLRGNTNLPPFDAGKYPGSYANPTFNTSQVSVGGNAANLPPFDAGKDGGHN